MTSAARVAACIIIVSSVLGLAVSIYLFVNPFSTSDSGGQSQPFKETIPLPDNNLPVLLKQGGFSPKDTKYIDVAANFDKDSYNKIIFFKALCNATSYTQNLLDPVNRSLTPTADHPTNRYPFNYHYGDVPVYSAGGNSSLVYNISASGLADGSMHNEQPAAARLHHSSCPLELFMFDSESNYTKFLQNKTVNVTGFVNRSGCIPVGVGDNVLHNSTVFWLGQPNFYYIMASVVAGINISTNISGHVRAYSTDQHNQITKCDLETNNRNACRISISNSDRAEFSHPVCIFAQAKSSSSLNVSAIDTHISGSTTISNIVATVLFSSLLVLLVMFVWISCQKNDEERSLLKGIFLD